MKEGEKRLAIGYNDEGEQVVLVGVPLDSKIPGKEDCIALVGELPIDYIADTLSLEDEDSLIYSFVIREDGGFVVRTSDAYRDNYFDRVESMYEDWKGKAVTITWQR